MADTVRMTPLCELARKYETDKGGWHLRYGGGDSDTCHNYTPAYWDMYGWRADRVTNVLEIGLGWTGSSVRMWAEFFPNARIIGLDTDAGCIARCKQFDTSGRVFPRAADQNNRESLLSAVDDVPQFDLIIDDASHELEHQINSMKWLLGAGKITADGLYVIEDMHQDCHPELIGQWVPPGYTWSAISTGVGIGKAHCWCQDCGQKGPEQLLVIRRGPPNPL